MRTDIIDISRARNVFLARTQDDVEQVLEHNKASRGERQAIDWGRHVASVPPIVLVKWMNEELDRGHVIQWWGPEFREMVYRKLNDPDWAYLRVD